MRASISKFRESIWVWFFWGVGTYLALGIWPFLLLGLALKKTASELV
jgi:hypothetical protein